MDPSQARVEWYRLKAARVRREAEYLTDRALRRQLLNVAREYQALAAAVHQIAKGPA